MPRGDQIARIFWIYKLLEHSRYGFSIEEITHKANDANFNCSLRTIRRDITALEKAHIPLYNEKINGKTKWFSNHVKERL